MDPRRPLCILLFAQLILVAYSKLIAQLTTKMWETRMGGREFDLHWYQHLARDYWIIVGIVLIAIFVALLWRLLRPEIVHTEMIAIYTSAACICIVLAVLGFFMTIGMFGGFGGGTGIEASGTS